MKKLSNFAPCGEVDTSITGKLLYLMLEELSDPCGEIIIPHRKISDTLRISKDTVSRNLRRLKAGGYIEIYARYHSEGGRAANKYVVKVRA